MDRLELAQRQYERIVPDVGAVLDTARSEELERWLREFVCPVVEHLLPLRPFQEQARWSVEHLARGIDAPERRCVDAVDEALVHCAQTLCAVARQPDVWAWLVRLAPPVDEAVQRSGARPAEPGVAAGPSAAPSGWAVVERVARRPWYDLVAVEDYFHPFRELNLTATAGEPLEEFDPLANPRLAVRGDYLCRLLFLRVEHWQHPLRAWAGRCLCALPHLERDATRDLEAVGMALATLEQRVQALRAACLTGEDVRRREASVALVQLYAGYHPCPQLDWLGPPATLAAGQRGLIRLCVRRPLCDPRVIEGVAAALVDIEALYRQAPSTADVVGAAVTAKALVLVESPRAAYWQGEALDVRWDDCPLLWELLWALAARGRQAQAVDRFCLSNPDSARAIVDRRSRLGRLLPPTLDDQIGAAGRRTYRLGLAAADIALFQVETAEHVIERGGPGAALS